MELLLLVPLENKLELGPSLLPVQPSWSTDPWEVRITRYQLHPGLLPHAYSTLPDQVVKSREVVSVILGHRKNTVYLYTKGVKEEILSKSADSILCAEESLLTRLQQAKILKAESTMELSGSVHKRDGLVFYQAIYKDTDKTSSLLFHLRVPQVNQSIPILPLLHSGIVFLPMTSRDAVRASKDSNATSLIFPQKAPLPSSSQSHASSSTDESAQNTNAQSNTVSIMDKTASELTESEILQNLPSFLANAKLLPIILSQTPKLLETATPASVSLPPSPYPYLTTETQMLRGRDRRAEEETDRQVALYYLWLVLSNKNK